MPGEDHDPRSTFTVRMSAECLAKCVSKSGPARNAKCCHLTTTRSLAHDFGVVESVGLQEVLWFAVGVDQNPKRDTHGI